MPTFYHRHLPHWRVEEDVPYFVTWRLRQGQPPLEDHERDIVAGALRHFDHRRYELLAWVVMHDHVHVLLVLAHDEVLWRVLHSWKSFTGHRLRSLGDRPIPVWQDESFDRIVRDDRELIEKVRYIETNPRKRWPELGEYRWVWHRWMEQTEWRDDDERDACAGDLRGETRVAQAPTGGTPVLPF